jgi:hypothetical protein
MSVSSVSATHVNGAVAVEFNNAPLDSAQQSEVSNFVHGMRLRSGKLLTVIPYKQSRIKKAQLDLPLFQPPLQPIPEPPLNEQEEKKNLVLVLKPDAEEKEEANIPETELLDQVQNIEKILLPKSDVEISELLHKHKGDIHSMSKPLQEELREVGKKVLWLDLSYNRLNSWQMRQIREYFPNTKELKLDNWFLFDNDILVEVAGFQNLETVSLNGCHQINSQGIEHLLKLRKLKSLSLQMCNITVEHLQKLKDVLLDDLDLSNTMLTDNHLAGIGCLRTLKRLNLSSEYFESHFTEEAYSTLVNLQMLEELNLTKCKISAAVLQNLSQLKSLKKLSLQSVLGLNDGNLGRFVNVISLDIQGIPLTHDLLAALALAFPKVHDLKISSHCLFDYMLRPLSMMKSLKSIKLKCEMGQQFLAETVKELEDRGVIVNPGTTF